MIYYDFNSFKELFNSKKNTIKEKVYAVIGNPIGHSMSPKLHSLLNGGCSYFAVMIKEEELKDFCSFARKNLDGFNVTVPFKKEILKYIDFTDNFAQNIGSVNTVFNSGGKLSGYNTDVYGLKAALEFNGASIKGCKALVLGSGGAALAAVFALKSGGADVTVAARNVLKAQKALKDTNITDISKINGNFDTVINCTPCGMKGQEDVTAINIKEIHGCNFLLDTVYNPLKTKLIKDAEDIKIKAVNGLEMLIFQGIKAQEIWGANFSFNKLNNIKNLLKTEVFSQRLNLKGKKSIALCGFMGSGKSSIASALEKEYGFSTADIDSLIAEKEKMPITKIFEDYGQQYFRNAETTVLKSIAYNDIKVISLGGGAVTIKENVDFLKENCLIYFIDVSLKTALKRADDGTRPLLKKSAEEIEILFNQRNKLYLQVCDIKIDGEKTLSDICEDIINSI